MTTIVCARCQHPMTRGEYFKYPVYASGWMPPAWAQMQFPIYEHRSAYRCIMFQARKEVTR